MASALVETIKEEISSQEGDWAEARDNLAFFVSYFGHLRRQDYKGGRKLYDTYQD